jgi:type I restriction enzyme, S subunit
MRERKKSRLNSTAPVSGERRALGDLGYFLKGRGISKADLTISGVPCLRYAEIYTLYGDVAYNLQSIVSDKVANEALTLEHGDIIFAGSGETAAEIGKAVAYVGNGRAVVGGDTIVLRGHGQDAAFLAHALNSDDAVRQKSRLGNGQSVVHIHAPELSTVEVFLPPISEQKRISQILQIWDHAIEQVSQLITLRKEQYIGIRGQLIDWSSDHQTALHEALEPVVRPTAKPTKPYRALSLRSHGKGSFVRNVENPDSVEMDTLYIAKAGDVIVNITFAWEGAIALVPPEHDGCLVSHRFPTFLPIKGKADTQYLRHALRMPRFTHLLALVSPGGAGRNRVLNKRDFLNLNVPLPSLRHQEKIGMALNCAERAIEGEIKHREALSSQKVGLMQKLLTGEWRVPMPPNGAANVVARVAVEASQ